MLYRVPLEWPERSLRPSVRGELAMGVQVVRYERSRIKGTGLLFSGLVVAPFEDGVQEGLQEIFEMQEQWVPGGEPETAARGPFYSWLLELPEIDRLTAVNLDEDVEWLIDNPQPLRPEAPLGGAYGHLPFRSATTGQDVFYRYEILPWSTWVLQSAREISAGTFAAPASELPFVPTGFAAVGRYALPKLPPYRFRWELQPEAGKEIDVGASVPLYGQAGGGVEVKFRDPTKNRGPIANPVKLPAY